MTVVLPTKKSEIERVNPRKLIVYSKPKAGKTILFANLEKSLLIDIESGSGFVSAVKIEANSLAELREIGNEILKQGRPYQRGVIDTVTALEDMCLELALKMYRATPIGKKYGFKEVDGKLVQEANVSILNLPNGAGYYWLRQAFFSVTDYIETLFDEVIYLGHIKDKVVDDKGEMVQAANIDLTGKIKSLVCANADAIGYLFRKGNQTFISFKATDEINCGARPEHLKNQEILIAEEVDGKYTTYWDKIYK